MNAQHIVQHDNRPVIKVRVTEGAHREGRWPNGWELWHWYSVREGDQLHIPIAEGAEAVKFETQGPATRHGFSPLAPQARDTETCAHNRANYGDPVQCVDCGATLKDGAWTAQARDTTPSEEA